MDKELTLTWDRLQAELSYDPGTGIFTWKRPHQRVRPGQRTGFAAPGKHPYIGLAGYSYNAGRLAWFYVHKRWPVGTLAYLDGDPANVALANLVDSKARRKAAKDAAPERHYPGVTWRVSIKRWQAQAFIGGRTRYIGLFTDQEAAYAAYKDFMDKQGAKA